MTFFNTSGANHAFALLSSVLAADAPVPAVASDSGGGGIQILVLLLMLGGMYFIVFAPQMKRQKEHQKLVEGLKTGDEVVTTGGIFGVITQVKPDRFVVEIAKGTRVEIRRSHVEAKVPDPAQADVAKKS